MESGYGAEYLSALACRRDTDATTFVQRRSALRHLDDSKSLPPVLGGVQASESRIEQCQGTTHLPVFGKIKKGPLRKRLRSHFLLH